MQYFVFYKLAKVSLFVHTPAITIHPFSNLWATKRTGVL